MAGSLTATAHTNIQASRERVYSALINPASIKEYMFGATVTTDWNEGSPITWKGEFQGKAYEDKGKILELRPPGRLKYTHFSPLAGAADAPENYHSVTFDLFEEDGGTKVVLTQDNCADEKAREHSEKNWGIMLEGLKKHVESQST